MESKNYTYENEEIEVTWDQKRCIHAKECVHGLPEVFDITKKPWINPDAAKLDDLRKVIEACPTGALHYHFKNGLEQEPVPDKNIIQITDNGPLYISGDVRIVTKDKEELLKDTRVAMCRCGASSNKPLCDNSHIESGFEASKVYNPERLELEPLEENGKPLIVNIIPNGPFVVEGNYEVHGANESSTKTSKKMSFCRCGASANKPFCDGAHKGMGFQG